MENFDKIEDYIRGNLSEKEAHRFREELKSNKDLAKDFRVFQLEKDLVSYMREEDTRQKLKQWKQKYETDSPTQFSSHTNLLLPLSIAAILLLTLGIFTWIYGTNNYSNTALANEAYQSQEVRILNNTKAVTDNRPPIFNGISEYDNGNYESAIRLFSAIQDTSTYFDNAQYGIAHAYYKLDDLESSIQRFEFVINNSRDNELREEAEWYLIVALLKQDNLGNTFKNKLNEIVNNDNHIFYKEAIDLNTKLNSL